jgi:ribose 5-phosphate isomerase
MPDNGQVSARTKIVLSPAQLVAVIVAAASLVLYLTDLRVQVSVVRQELTAVRSDLGKLDRRVARIDGMTD